MRFIDLSITIENDLASDPKEMIPQIMYMDHEQSVPDMLRFFGTAQSKDLPDGLAWAIEKIELTTHTGTHLDAPYHYHPTMDKGKPAWTIDEIPLDWCYGDGVVLDFSDKPDGTKLTVKDFEEALSRIDYELKEQINTGEHRNTSSADAVSAEKLHYGCWNKEYVLLVQMLGLGTDHYLISQKNLMKLEILRSSGKDILQGSKKDIVISKN